MRLEIFQRLVFIFIGLILLALFYNQIIRGFEFREQSTSNRIRVISYEAPRGRILDRNAMVLADNRISFNVAILPQDVDSLDDIAAFLSSVIKLDAPSIKKIYFRRKLTPFDPVVIAEDVEQKVVIRVEENKFQYPGLEIITSYERYYPFHEAGAHAVGYVGRVGTAEAEMLKDFGYTPLSLVGKTGAESSFESVLFGLPGGKQIEVNSRGRQVRLLGTKESVQGDDIVLTLDQRLQNIAHQLLAGRRGSIVVLDLSTAEVLTMVSSPSFDPNAFTDRSMNHMITHYVRSAQGAMINRAINSGFPPGSLFKIPVALAAIEKKKIIPQTEFDCPGYYMLGQARFGCAHVHRQENLYEAIAHSCNVYFYYLAQKLGPENIGAYARAFGLGRPTGIDLPFENKGNLVYPGRGKKTWYTGNTLNLSIGQGDTLSTPLQIAVMMGAVALRGIVVRPFVLKQAGAKVLAPQDYSKRPTVRLRAPTWDTIEQGMKLVVKDPEGTGHILNGISNVAIYGKTGTAQAGKGKEDHAWFAGYLHSPKKSLAFCVLLEHGGSSANAVALTNDLVLQMQNLGVI